VRGSVELASPVDVERSSFIFKEMGKRSRFNCDKNGCKCKKQRKTVTLEEKLSVIKMYENNECTVDIIRATGLSE
jgi:hypothetical protein